MEMKRIEQEVDRYLDQLSAQDDFSGVILLAGDGSSFFQKACGLAHQGYQIPNQINTQFNIGSATKMFTGCAVAQLAERKKVRFDDPIGKYLSMLPKEIGGRVTVHHLLTHTSGMAGSILGEQTFRANKDLVRTTADWMRLVLELPLLFEPGTAWSYSNAGFLVLGRLIEELTGQTYFDYVSDHIWKPAGMLDTNAIPLDIDVPGRALGYLERQEADPADRPRRNNISYSLIRGSAHGGAWSTAEDLLRFVRALQSDTLLGPAYREIMLSEKVPTGRRPGEGYAYGFFTETVNGQAIVGHGGRVAGFSAWVDMYRGSGYTVVILSNYSPPAAQQMGQKVRTLIVDRA